MTYHVYDGHRTVYETLDEARTAAQAAIDECRKQSTVYEWPSEVSEIVVYEAPADCEKPWRDGTLVLEVRERVIEDEDHPLDEYSEFELVVADLLPDDDDSNEEPGEMCKRALATAKGRVDLIKQVRLLVVGAEDEADFEATYGTDPDEIAVYTNAAREIIDLVRATPAPDTITLSLDQLTSALREAAAFGTDLSSCSSTTAGAVREVADLVLEAVVSGRAIGDEYDTLLDAEKRIAR